MIRRQKGTDLSWKAFTEHCAWCCEAFAPSSFACTSALWLHFPDDQLPVGSGHRVLLLLTSGLKCLFRSVFSSAEIKAPLFSRARSYTCRKLFWQLWLSIPNAALDRHESLGPSLQAVLKGNGITACSWHTSYYINPVLQGIHGPPLGQEGLFFFPFLSWCINWLLIFLVWLLFCSSNDQPTGNRPRV